MPREGRNAASDACDVSQVLGTGEGDGARRRVEARWERNGKTVSVCPTCYCNATSLLEGVVRVQSCLSRRQVISAMPGCGGKFDDV